MAEQYIQLPANSTGLKVRTFEQTIGANVVEHQAFVLCDSNGNIISSMTTAPLGSEQGIVVRPVESDVIGSGTITTTDAVVAAPAGAGAFVSGASTAGSLVAVQCPGGDSAWNVQITGLTSGTLYFEGSLDSTTGTDGNWINVNGRQTGVVNTVLAGSATANGMYRGNTSGLKWFRVRSVGALSGTPAMVIRLSDGHGALFLNASVPAGSNEIGRVRVTDGTNIGSVSAIGTRNGQDVNVVGSAGGISRVTNTFGAAPGAITLPNTANVANTTVTVVASQAGNATIDVSASAYVGTIIFEGSSDGGTTWFTVAAAREDGTGMDTTIALSGATGRAWTTGVPGFTHLRVRATAWTSGTLTVGISLGAFLVEPTTITTIGAAIPTGANVIGAVTQSGTWTTNDTPPAITKGTQGTTGYTTQDLKDAGRSPVSYYTVIPILATATDTLQSLTGTKGGATVGATTTPAVVTAGKTFRIQEFSATYIATATSGYGIVRLRYNTGGVVAITSPILATLAVGAGTPATANSVGTEVAVFPDGKEVPAAAGIGISVQGFAAGTATAVGYVFCSVAGYEY